MKEEFENNNKFDLFKSYNHSLEDNITSIIKEYDKKYVSAINGLSSLISNFINNTKSYLIALCKVSSTLKNQILYSEYLLTEINNKKEKYSQIRDRIDMINNTRKLFDNHLLMLNSNLNIFISDAKKEFKDIKSLRNSKLNLMNMVNNKRYDTLYNKSSSRGRVKKNIFEIEEYFSNDKIFAPNNNRENVYNNFIQCSNIQKNNNLLEKQDNYRKKHFNQSHEKFFVYKRDNTINNKKSSSVIKEKNSRNKNITFQNSYSSRNNSSAHAKQPEIMKKQNMKSNLSIDVNTSELNLAYKVLEFIFIINNLQYPKIKNNNNEINMKIESLKNNLMKLTKEVINQNKNDKKIKNKNIINNNIIYNNKENFEIKEDDIIFNDNDDIGDNSIKFKALYDQIDKLKSKNKDLELLIKIKNKENKKLNKIINDKKMLESYQRNNDIKIKSNSSEKLTIKNRNIKNNYKIENNNNKAEPNEKNDIILLLNKKIEDLNSTIKNLNNEKNQIKNDLTGKINVLINKNKNAKSDYENLINNLSKDLKDKDIQIDNLNNQIQDLNSQIKNRNNEDKNKLNNNIINDTENEYDSKMLMLKEKNKILQNNLDSFDDKIKFNEKNIEILKKNINENKNKNNIKLKITKINFSFIAKRINPIDIKYSPDNYEILSDKFYNNIQWFLLINKKDKTTILKDYHKMIWAEKSQLINLENFNKYTSEVEESNKNIIKYISKLEEKEDMISKLSYRLNQIEKLNSQEDSNIIYNKTEKTETIITIEKYINLLSKLKNFENEINILKKENLELKAINKGNKNKNDENNINNNNNNGELDEYNKFEEKIKNGEMKMSENMKKIINNHFNTKKEEEKDDSMDNNYLNSNENIEDENNKITEKIEEENESSEKNSESSEDKQKNYYGTKNNTINILRKQLERITKLYEELEKRLKKIKSEVQKIFSNIVIKEKEKEINNLLEICGFTEDEISEMLLLRES